MSASRVLLALFSLLSFSALLQSVLSQTATPGTYGTDPNPPEIAGTPSDRTTATGYTPTAAQIAALNNIDHFVIVPFGAQSFDSIMGTFPGANGISSWLSSASYTPQKDMYGNVYQGLPTFNDTGSSKTSAAAGVIPNNPFDIIQTLGITMNTVVGNPSHSYFQQKFKYNGSQMDGFVAFGGSLGTLSMGYYNLSQYAPNNGLFALAGNYTLFDRFHVSSIPDSVAQHLYFVGGKTVPYNASYPNLCPSDVVALYNTTLFPQTYTNGSKVFMTSWTQQPPLDRQCHFIGELNSANLCSGNPPFMPEIPNGQSNPQQIGDVFDIYNTSWAWYAEDFLGAEAADCTQPGQRQFNVHDQPWQHYSTFALNNSDYWSLHQKDALQFWTALAGNTLEPLTWYVPSQVHDFGWSNNSPGAGNAFVDSFVANITASALWQSGKLAVIFTWVGPNGLFDHVAPYPGDTYGPGGRVPHIIMSPYHKASSKPINSDPYETYSIYKMITRRFNMSSSYLQQIWGSTRYLAAADMTLSFQGASTTASSSTGGSGNGGSSGGGNTSGASMVSAACGMLVALVAGMLMLML